MAICRPDIFLNGKYLKYFGWMLSDKAECIRIAALKALNLPFKVVKEAENVATARTRDRIVSVGTCVYQILGKNSRYCN